MATEVNYQTFYITFKENSPFEGQYCRIHARIQSDAQKKAQREFPHSWNEIYDNSFKNNELIEPLEAHKLDPLTVSYEGWNPNEMSSAGKGGNVRHDKIRSRSRGEGS